MKIEKLSVSVKCIIVICSVLFIFSCATYKQHGFPSELLGTWFFAYEDTKGFFVEQVYTFNSDGHGTIEFRQYSNLNWEGEVIRLIRPEDIKVFNLLPSSEKGKITIIVNGSYGQGSYIIDNNYLIDQTGAKYRKLSDIEVEKWLNAKGSPFSEM